MPDFGRWTANGGDPSLNDINRADRFLDALANEQAPFSTDHGDAELAQLLSGWRDDVRQVPMDHVVSPAQASAALVDATSAPQRRNRLGLTVLSSAAAVLCLGGFGTAVFTAGPGDGLYGVRTMIFGEQTVTRDDAVVLAAQTELAQVQQLVDQGQWEQAQDKLAALSSTVQSVGPVEQKQELIQQWNALTYKVVEQDPAATLPPAGEPMPVLPESPLTLLPVPVVETTDPVGTPTDVPGTTSPGPEVLSTAPSETTSSETTSPTTTSPTTSPTTTASTETSTSATTTTAPSSTTSTTPSSSTTTAPSTTTTTTAPRASTTTAPTTTNPPTTTTVTQATTTNPPTTSAPRATVTSAPPTATTTVAPPVAEEPATQQAPAPTVEAPATTEAVVEPTQPEEEPSAPAPVTTTTTVPAGDAE